MTIIKAPIKFASQLNDTRSKVSSLERAVNMYAEPQQNAESPFAMLPTPGCRPVINVTSETDQTAGVLAMTRFQGSIYVVTKSGLHRVYNDMTLKVGSAVFTSSVSITSNNDSIVVVDGQYTYAYTPSTGSWQKLDTFPSQTIAYIDGYLILSRRSSNQFFVSNPDSIVFDPLNFAEAEGSPDLLVSVLADHRELWLFGETTTEIWYNSGNDFPFDRLGGGYVEKGIASPTAMTKINNTVYWLGNDRIVYSARGYQPQRVSDYSVDNELSFGDLSEAFMFSYTFDGHDFIHLTVPGLDKTFVYDAVVGAWHIQTTDGGRHLASCALSVIGDTYVGDYRKPVIYLLDSNYPYHGDSQIERDLIFPPIFGETNRMRHAALEVKLQNIANSISPTQSPMIGLSWTDNQGGTWTPFWWIPAGQIGKYDYRAQWLKLGSFYERTYRIRMVSDISPIFGGAYAG